MKNKDEALTKKELTALCRKQEEYIKELEEKLKTPSDTEKCIEPAKPDYDKLRRQNESLSKKIIQLEQENDALRYSLTEMYMDLKGVRTMSELWQESFYEEHKRAEKLFEEVNKANDK